MKILLSLKGNVKKCKANVKEMLHMLIFGYLYTKSTIFLKLNLILLSL